MLSIDGVAPNAATVEDGTYPLARPLFLYTTAKIMQEKPQVAAFINFYLTYVNEEIGEVGYFPASAEALDAAQAGLARRHGPIGTDPIEPARRGEVAAPLPQVLSSGRGRRARTGSRVSGRANRPMPTVCRRDAETMTAATRA